MTPYVSHVFRVAMTLRDLCDCKDQATLVAAVLHDTIEDTTTDYDELEEHFGAQVADIVATLTKNMSLREREREADYDARLARGDWRARLIKLADVYDNLCDWTPAIDLTREDVLDKCQRAIALALRDEAAHPEISRAITLIRGATSV